MNLQQEALDSLLTVRDWIRFGVTRLEQSEVVYGQGTDNAWDESVFLVLRSLNLPVDDLTPFLDARVLPHEKQTLFQRMEQRCNDHVPAAYILGEAWLAGHRFKVSRDVLIPRSPISEVLMNHLQPWIDPNQTPSTIVDACTGSGCLAILAALQFPEARVLATDISQAALAIAQQNVHDYGLEDQIELISSHLIEAVPEYRSCDLIICNPPYVNAQSMSALPQEYLHEPQIALAGGSNGMDLVAELLQQARTRLKPDGWLLLEVGHEQVHFEQAFPQLSPIWLSTQAADNQIMLIAGRDLVS